VPIVTEFWPPRIDWMDWLAMKSSVVGANACASVDVAAATTTTRVSAKRRRAAAREPLLTIPDDAVTARVICPPR